MKKPIQFGKYSLLDRVNVGGMAEVFKAKAFGVEGFERLLAVKRILPNIAEDEEFITMFIDEAKIAVQLNHANIAQIFDLGKVDDSYFIALEFVHGKDLRALFDRCKLKPEGGQSSLPIAQACFVIMKCCEGLDYAHNKRDAQGQELHLVHRDVSPQNVLVSYEGEVKLIDFGIAKAAGKMSKTQQGILKGKFGYMSPEQVRGLPLDRRSDVFSLGIVLYELLTGERLFVGESDFSTLEKVRNVEILPPSTYNRRISDELERIVMKTLAKDVDDRYQNAIDLHDDLQAFMYTAGEFYSRKDLAVWMKRVFASEIEAESAKLETYRQMPASPSAAPGGAPGAAPAVEAAERPRRSTPPPPPPAGALAQASNSGGANASASANPNGSPRRPSGQHAEVAARPAITPPQATPAPAPQNGSAKAHGLGWDEEELATNIYDTPEDAEDAVVEDKPNDGRVDLSSVELSVDGKPVPSPAPSFAGAHNGSAKPFDFSVPEGLGGPFSRGVVPSLRKSSTPLYLALGGVALLLGVLGIVSLLVGSKPGEVVITSEPAAGVQVLVDQKRIEVDGTPATLKLAAGPHVLTVQREGYVPWNQTIDVESGGRSSQHAALEPLAQSTGFTLVSDPPGAQALLDGKFLDGLTPLKVQSVQPGKHQLEVVSPAGQKWNREIDLEGGKIIEVRAQISPTSPPPAPPSAPVAAAPRPTPPAAPAPPKKSTAPERTRELPRPPREEKVAVRANVPQKKRAPVPVEESSARPEVEKPEKAKPAGGSGEGYLRLGSKPWTHIAVDGKDSGLHTPQTKLKLPAGTHRITLTNAQFEIKETFSVEIRTDQTETVIKDLRPQGAADSD